jgi:hypothetical protein
MLEMVRYGKHCGRPAALTPVIAGALQSSYFCSWFERGTQMRMGQYFIAFPHGAMRCSTTSGWHALRQPKYLGLETPGAVNLQRLPAGGKPLV